MSNVMRDTMKSGEIADKMGIETVTLRKYCLVLEQNGYFINRNGKNREFTVKDLEILTQMKYLIETVGMDRSQSAKIVISKVNSNITDTENILPSTNVTQEKASSSEILERIERYAEQQSDIQHNVGELTKMISFLYEQAVDNEKKRIEEQRQAALNARFTLRMAEYKLEEEAHEIWKQKPEEERITRVGIFKRKVENVEGKEKFVKKYIAERLESELDK